MISYWPIGLNKIKFVRFTAIAGIVLSLAVGIGDYYRAKANRDFSLYLKKRFNKKEVWFPNHWGFQYYMEKAGFKCLPLGKGLPKGSLFATSSKAAAQVDRNIYEGLRLRFEKEANVFFPVRTMSSGAGFYIHDQGLLPYAFGRERLDIFRVFKKR